MLVTVFASCTHGVHQHMLKPALLFGCVVMSLFTTRLFAIRLVFTARLCLLSDSCLLLVVERERDSCLLHVFVYCQTP